MDGRKPDYGFLGLLGAIMAIGLVMLTSASAPDAFHKFNDGYWFVKHQIAYGLVPGAVLFFVMSRVDYRRWRVHAKTLFIVSIGLLLLVFVPGLGADWGTAKSWIHVGPFSLQPAEIVKLTFLFYLAAWMETRGEEGVADLSRGVVPFLSAFGIIALLLMLQPDLGGLLVFASMAFAVYFVAGARWSHIAALAGAGALALAALIKSAPYRAARLMTFLHPELDPQGIGYHINQAFLAIGSGGWFGLGLGHSRQKYLYLPEVAGDSIFAVLAEELGFIFTLAVLAVFTLFLFKCIDIARRAPDDYGRFIAAGIAGWIFSQMLFNIGSMVGLMPMTGLPLPFVSYGGTAFMVLLAAMGVLANVSKQGHPAPARR
jgi:cell division protein FtsW